MSYLGTLAIAKLGQVLRVTHAMCGQRIHLPGETRTPGGGHILNLPIVVVLVVVVVLATWSCNLVLQLSLYLLLYLLLYCALCWELFREVPHTMGCRECSMFLSIGLCNSLLRGREVHDCLRKFLAGGH